MKISIQSLMEKSGVKFGTSGARGLVSEMTDLVCYSYTKGFLQYLKSIGQLSEKKEKVAIAGDLRGSTDRIMVAVEKAVSDFGCLPVNTGKIPTPAVSFFGFENGFPSIMITGSHIPDDRNGIKFNKAVGEVLKDDEAKIRAQEIAIDDNLFDESGNFKKSAEISYEQNGDAKNLYEKRYLNFFLPNCLSGFKIGFYEHSAVVRDMLPQILQKLGAEVKTFGRSEKFIAVDNEALNTETLSLVKNFSKEHQLDAIVSTDGDSDRPIIFDENGEWIENDLADIVCAKYLSAETVCTTLTTSTALEKSGFFKKISRTKIGSPYVIASMNEARESGAKKIIGYENNGGFLIDSDFEIDGRKLKQLPTRDTLIVLLSILCEAKMQKKRLSELLNGIPQRFVFSNHIVNFSKERGVKLFKEFFDLGSESADKQSANNLFGKISGEASEINRFDGVRITFKNGEIIHLRPSGNAPELRIYTEAGTVERAAEINKKAMERVRKILENSK